MASLCRLLFSAEGKTALLSTAPTVLGYPLTSSPVIAALASILATAFLVTMWDSPLRPIAAGTTRNVVLTGAASGIGRATATRLHGLGWTVYALDINMDLLDTLSETLGAARLHLIHADVTSVDSCEAASLRIRELLALAGDRRGSRATLDALIHAAGITHFHPLLCSTEKEIDLIFAVNTIGPLRLTRLLQDLLLEGERGGALCHVASVAGRMAFPWQGAYT